MIKKPANKIYIKLMNIIKYLDLKLFSNQLFNNRTSKSHLNILTKI